MDAHDASGLPDTRGFTEKFDGQHDFTFFQSHPVIVGQAECPLTGIAEIPLNNPVPVFEATELFYIFTIT